MICHHSTISKRLLLISGWNSLGGYGFSGYSERQPGKKFVCYKRRRLFTQRTSPFTQRYCDPSPDLVFLVLVETVEY